MGAVATVSKGNPTSELFNALCKVREERRYHTNIYPDHLENNHSKLLTPREKQILTMVATGMTSRQISVTFNISEFTVNKHRANIKKMNLHNIS